MSDIKAKKMSPELIATLSKYEDRFRRAIRGERVELSSVGIKELEKAHFELFGARQSMTQCCRGSRDIADRIAPIAKAYFKQINGSEKKTTGLKETIEGTVSKVLVVETKTAQDSIEAIKPNTFAASKIKAVKQPKNE